MDQRTPADLYQSAVKAALDIVSEATLARITLPQSDLPDSRLEKVAKAAESKIKVVFLFAVGLFAVIVSSGLLGKYFGSRSLATISAGVMALLIIMWFLYFLVVTLPRIPGIIRFLRVPSEPLLQLVKHAISVERSYLDRLGPIDVNAIKHVLAHFKNERHAMEKRGSAFSGSIDRLGLFPAIGGVAIMYFGLRVASVRIEYIQALVSLTVVFHIFSFMAIGLYQKIDRIIVMLELSISTRDSIKQD